MGKARMYRSGFAVMLAATLAFALAAPASAAPAPGHIACVATPKVVITQDQDDTGVFHWSVHGSGACVAPKGTLTVRIDGEGQGLGLGFCTGAFIQDLVIPITMTVERVFSGETYTRSVVWTAPVTTFPEATPFAIVNPDNETLVGAGVIFTHIFFGCLPDDPRITSSTVVWAQDFAGSGAPPA